MARGITVDISARITGYEQSLQQLRNALAKLNPGSEIAKSITKALDVAENKVRDLSKNLTPKVSNDSQLDRLTDKVNTAGEAILHTSDLLKKVSKEDVNFSSFGDGIDKLTQQINTLQDQLENKLSIGLQHAIANSAELQDVFKRLDLNITGMEPGQIFEALAKKAEEAAKTTEQASQQVIKAQQDLAKKESSLNAIKNNPLFDKGNLENELQQIVTRYNDTFNKIKEQISAGLGKLNIDKGVQEDFLAVFTGGLTRNNLSEHIQTLKNSVKAELQKMGTSMGDNDIFKALFPDVDIKKSKTGQNIALILDKVFPNMQEAKALFEQKINEISGELTNTQVGNLKSLISEENIDAALQQTIKYVEAAYIKLQGAFTKSAQAVVEARENVSNAESGVTLAQTQESVIQKAVGDLEQQLKQVEEDNAALRRDLEALKTQRSNSENVQTEQVQAMGKSAAEGAKNWKIGTGAVNEYSAAIEKVHEREQLVGKIEGVVQRWFSVYAAVRMVGNAVRSVISTIKELDKTITDITIVTNMSREDLWGQMPQYTKMAQDYAVSISGVYQVSQLFYQQGLQTNDVMTLTAETLKMARIAGLDYAEATNYMTNALRSFKLDMEEANRVTDAYSVLAANAAVSVSEIAEAMSKTASSAYAVGASLENTATMITVMTEATRESASNIGSALKSIISRYGEMTSDPKKLIDSEGEEMSLNKVDRALQSVGITLQDTQGQFRAFDDVIMELASVWDTLDANTQRYIATVMAFLYIRRRLVM